jgi:hypothetical protein
LLLKEERSIEFDVPFTSISGRWPAAAIALFFARPPAGLDILEAPV